MASKRKAVNAERVRGSTKDDSPKSGKDRPKRMIGNYVLGKTLGGGTYGKVKYAEHELTHQAVAIKIYDRKNDGIDPGLINPKVRREMEILKLVSHPHIIQQFQVMSTPTAHFIIMEYADNGELFEYMEQHAPLREEEARRLFQQLICALEYCHHFGIAHRDLKPENILLDQNLNLKIADWGLANFMKDGELFRTACGSPNYAAPEVVSGKLYDGPEADVWSAGCILYMMVSGKMPFDADSVGTLYNLIQEGKFEMPQSISDGCQGVLRGMLETNPVHRWKIQRIREDPWFLADLPAYLQKRWNPATPLNRSKMDPEVVHDLSSRPYFKDAVRRGAESNSDVLQLSTAYELLELRRSRHSSSVHGRSGSIELATGAGDNISSSVGSVGALTFPLGATPPTSLLPVPPSVAAFPPLVHSHTRSHTRQPSGHQSSLQSLLVGPAVGGYQQSLLMDAAPGRLLVGDRPVSPFAFGKDKTKDRDPRSRSYDAEPFRSSSPAMGGYGSSQSSASLTNMFGHGFGDTRGRWAVGFEFVSSDYIVLVRSALDALRRLRFVWKCKSPFDIVCLRTLSGDVNEFEPRMRSSSVSLSTRHRRRGSSWFQRRRSTQPGGGVDDGFAVLPELPPEGEALPAKSSAGCLTVDGQFMKFRLRLFQIDLPERAFSSDSSSTAEEPRAYRFDFSLIEGECLSFLDLCSEVYLEVKAAMRKDQDIFAMT